MKRRNLWSVLEPLEARQLCAVISYDDDILNIEGSRRSETIYLEVRAEWDELGEIHINGQIIELEQQVFGVNIYGNDGSDNITIYAVLDLYAESDGTPTRQVPINVVGGRGNDRISVNSDQNVFIDGGSGNDNLRARGNGPTEVFGGDGNDYVSLHGNTYGTDDDLWLAFGESGNDEIFSNGTGSFVLDGGEGRNKLYGSAGTTDFYVGASSKGRDSIFGGSGDDTVYPLGLGYINVKGGRDEGDDRYVISEELHEERSWYRGLTVLSRYFEIEFI